MYSPENSHAQNIAQHPVPHIDRVISLIFFSLSILSFYAIKSEINFVEKLPEQVFLQQNRNAIPR